MNCRLVNLPVKSVTGSVRERFISSADNEDVDVDGRIELITSFVSPLGDDW